MFYAPVLDTNKSEEKKELLGRCLINLDSEDIGFNFRLIFIYKRVLQFIYVSGLTRLEFDLTLSCYIGLSECRTISFYNGFNAVKTKIVLQSLVKRGWIETFKKETRYNYYRTSPKFLALLSDIDTYLIELRRLRQAAIDKRAEKEAKKRK